MTVGVVIGVGVLGGLGAIVRFLLDGAVSDRLGRTFPYGTLVVNLSGGLLLGLLAGAGVTGDASALAGTGAMGGYTTFSTWMLESHRLAEEGQSRPALANLAVPLLAGLAAAAAGRALGAWL